MNKNELRFYLVIACLCTSLIGFFFGRAFETRNRPQYSVPGLYHLHDQVINRVISIAEYEYLTGRKFSPEGVR